MSTCSDTTKLFSASGSKKGAVISRTSSVNADVDFYLISSDINKSQGMRIYANGDGTSQNVQIRFGNFGGNKYYYYSASIPANGGFITIKPGIKVYNNGVDGNYGNETLTLETYRSKISTFRIHFTTKADATAYIDDIQLDMTGNVPEASNVYTIDNIYRRIAEEVPDKLTTDELATYNYHKNKYYKNKHSLGAMFLYFIFRIKTYEKSPRNYPISEEMKKEINKMELYNLEVRFMDENKIDTLEELSMFSEVNKDFLNDMISLRKKNYELKSKTNDKSLKDEYTSLNNYYNEVRILSDLNFI